VITNAEHHRHTERKGEWRTAHKLQPCSRYFGDLACCLRVIKANERYFNTQETVPDAGMRHPFRVCAHCANALHNADFLTRRERVERFIGRLPRAIAPSAIFALVVGVASALTFLVAALLTGSARADTWLSATVASYHFDRSRDFNEHNWGIGIEHDAPSGKARFIGGIYRDSFDRDNRYIGISYTPLKLGPASFGVAIGLQHAGTLLPMFLPVVQIEGKNFGINIVAAPRISETTTGFLGAQIKFKAFE